MRPKRANWGSSIGFIFAASGSAVGLGNIWKFPYITGQNGGALFILIYLVCILLIGLPIMFSELSIGKHSQSNVVGAFRFLEKGKTFWTIIGFFGVIASFCILSYYSVVSGWILDYIFKAISSSFDESTSTSLLSKLLDNAWYLVFLHFVFMLVSTVIVMFGISSGIEKVSKVLMPTLFVLLLFLFVYSFFLPGNAQAYKFMFYPSFDNFKAYTLIEALGQAFFTLSLGMGTMITYGSYLKKQEKLLKSSLIIIVLDTLIAILAGIVVFSIVFSHNIEVSSGPSLIFSSLPALFGKMYLGNFLAFLFFILLAFAALTSAISIFEVVVSYCVETFKFRRKPTTIGVGFLAFLFGILSALSFNKLANFKLPLKFLFNADLTFFDTFDKVSSNLLLPLGGLLISIYAGWKMDKKVFEEETSSSEKKLLPIFSFLLKYIIPVVILIMFLYGINIEVFKILGLS